MKIFLSWSGARSRALAQALREWIPFVLPYAEPWMSESELGDGQRWSAEVAGQLAGSDFAILCLTRSDVGAPWRLYEAGALRQYLSEGTICCCLSELDYQDLPAPLALYQARKTEPDAVLELLEAINTKAAAPIDATRLAKFFESFWPQLEASLTMLPAETTAAAPRAANEVLEDVVITLRDVERRVKAVEAQSTAAQVRDSLDLIRGSLERVKESIIADFSSTLGGLEGSLRSVTARLERLESTGSAVVEPAPVAEIPAAAAEPAPLAEIPPATAEPAPVVESAALPTAAGISQSDTVSSPQGDTASSPLGSPQGDTAPTLEAVPVDAEPATEAEPTAVVEPEAKTEPVMEAEPAPVFEPEAPPAPADLALEPATEPPPPSLEPAHPPETALPAAEPASFDPPLPELPAPDVALPAAEPASFDPPLPAAAPAPSGDLPPGLGPEFDVGSAPIFDLDAPAADLTLEPDQLDSPSLDLPLPEPAVTPPADFAAATPEDYALPEPATAPMFDASVLPEASLPTAAPLPEAPAPPTDFPDEPLPSVSYPTSFGMDDSTAEAQGASPALDQRLKELELDFKPDPPKT